MFRSIINQKNELIFKVLFLIIFLILIFGRSFLGIFIFGFRLAELLTGFSILITIIVILKNKYFSEQLGNKIINSFYLLIIYFLLLNLKNSASFFDLYLYKSSVFIWYIAFLFFGYLIFKNITITTQFFYVGYFGLFIVYILSIIIFPELLTDFFNQYSDKTRFLKGSEIAIFFLVVTFYAYKFSEKSIFTNLFVLFSSAYIPFIFFKSRAAGFAIFTYIIFILYKKKRYFLESKTKTIILILFSSVLFALTSHFLIDNTYAIEDTPDAITQVFKHKYTVSNVYDSEVPLFYIYEKRLYSADGNLNWRLQLWQEIFSFANYNNEIIFGHGFHKKPIIFDNLIYSELDGFNENPHNFLINIFMRSGIIGVLLVIFLFFNLLSVKTITFTKIELLIFCIPLLFISMFDGSMENPYFGITFYFFMSSFFSGVTFKNRIKI